MNNRIKLSTVTTYKFGGYCDNFIEINSKEDLSHIKRSSNLKKIFVLGKGSNVAFSDKGYEGTVINHNLNGIKYCSESDEIKVEAGYYLPDLARFYKKYNLENAEFLIGIPGSVGGAVKMNAGAYEKEFSDIINSVETYNLESCKFETFGIEELQFSYRNSTNFNNRVVLSVNLKAFPGDPKKINKTLKSYIQYRKRTQPAGIYNAGSVFKNGIDYSAGELIDKAGLKGYSVDGVRVSEKHANFFIAPKGSKAISLYNLVNYVKEKVDTKYGVALEKEILFIGVFE